MKAKAGEARVATVLVKDGFLDPRELEVRVLVSLAKRAKSVHHFCVGPLILCRRKDEDGDIVCVKPEVFVFELVKAVVDEVDQPRDIVVVASSRHFRSYYLII